MRGAVAFVLSGSLVLAQAFARAQDATPAADATQVGPGTSEGRPLAHRVTHNALVLQPIAFAERGVALAYERALPRPTLALLARFSFAGPVSGDFRSRGFGVGVEGRWYFLGRGPFTRYEGPAPVGPYLGARLGLTTTTVVERANERTVGRSERLTLELTAGCRFTIAGIVELTPFVGMALYSDFVANMAPTFLPKFALGATVGGMFERRRGTRRPTP